MKSIASGISIKRFVPAMILMISGALLPSCANSAKSRLRVLPSQPGMLILPAGQPVQTTKGIYTPQTEEQWFSPILVRDLELMVLSQ